MPDGPTLPAELGLDPPAPLLGSGDDAIEGVVVEGTRALEIWEGLRRALPGQGFWPVILGSLDSVRSHREVFEYEAGTDPMKTVRDAAEIDAEQWFRGRLEEEAEYIAGAHGPWPADPHPNSSFTVHTDIVSGRPLPRVHIALVPTPSPWQAPAYLHFGGWNACPMPADQVAVLQYWFGKHGAVVLGISRDVLECAVATPPTDEETATRLAEQQYLYCNDIVDQGTGTIEVLAGTLLQGTSWFFWWD